MMKLVSYILFVLAILGLLHVFWGYTEGFALRPGAFPCSVDQGNVADVFPEKNPVTLANTYADNSHLESYTEMSNYAQETNNKRVWSTPDNGTCSPAELCNAMYSARKEIMQEKYSGPKDDGVRVNYYDSN